MQNSAFEQLDEFPFRRLAALLDGVVTPAGMAPIDLSIGEPKHAPPTILAETVARHGDKWNRYPPPLGTPAFRAAVVEWLNRRFGLEPGFIDPDRHVLPLAGTKEGLFLLPSVVTERRQDRQPLVLMPDPVYSVYVGAAVLAGAVPMPLPATRATGFLPDLEAIDENVLDAATMLTICSPANPQGAIADAGYIERALELARRHDFLLVLDECYSEIYSHEPSPGGLEVAQATGQGLANLVVMHSLSKRSNAAGLRSGFIAGDDAVLKRFARLRAYGGAVQPMPLMEAAIELWRDETHVEESREAYRRKIRTARRLIGNRFGFFEPEGGFFLWLEVEDSEIATRRLWEEAALKVLPGRYLTASEDPEGNIGGRYIRLALVHDEATVEAGINRLIDVLGNE